MNRLFVTSVLGLCLACPSLSLAQTKTDKPADKPAAPSMPAAKKPDAAKPMDKKPDAPEMPDMKAIGEAWEKAGEPGPQHKAMEFFVGTWQCVVRDLTPGAETEDKGTFTCEMSKGGRFMTGEFKGRSHGKFFYGSSWMGYNNASKQYESTWIDSMSSSISFMTGTVDSAGKVFTMSGEMTDPMSGKKSKQKEVMTITGKDSYTMDFYMDMGGKEMKVMNITYTRGEAKKADDKDHKGEKADKPAPKKEDAPKSKP